MKFGQYELLDRIAVGGMAEVYRGRALGEEGFVKQVAIKRILPGYARDARFISMLVTEARIQAQLSHRNIVQIQDLGVSEEGEYFIVLEFVDGRDLAALLDGLQNEAHETGRTARLPDAVALHVAIELGEGMHYAHEMVGPDGQPLGMVHRDVSPSNVLVSYAGEVKLSDFGLAKRRTDQSVVASLKGKLAYMSPEQARRVKLDRRSDIFSLGAVLFELVTGRRLRDIQDEGTGWQQVASGLVPPARGVRPDMPPVLDRLLAGALAPDPRDRFANAGEFVVAARAALDLVPRGRTGEATELAEYLSRLIPPGSPRTSADPSKVIRLVSGALDSAIESLAGPHTRIRIAHEERRPPAATTQETAIGPMPTRSAAGGDEVTRIGKPPTRPEGHRSSKAAGSPVPKPTAATPSTSTRTARATPPPVPQPTDGRSRTAVPGATTGSYAAYPGVAAVPDARTSAAPPRATESFRPPSASLPAVNPNLRPSPVAARMAVGAEGTRPPRLTPSDPLAPRRTTGSIPALPLKGTPSAPLPLPHPNANPVIAPRIVRTGEFKSTRSPPRPRIWTRVLVGLVVTAACAAATIHFGVLPLPVLATWAQPLRIDLRTDPGLAEVRLDGKRLPEFTPTSIFVPRDRRTHVLEIRREGFRPLQKAIRFDRNLVLVINLPLEAPSRPAVTALPAAPLPPVAITTDGGVPDAGASDMHRGAPPTAIVDHAASAPR